MLSKPESGIVAAGFIMIASVLSAIAWENFKSAVTDMIQEDFEVIEKAVKGYRLTENKWPVTFDIYYDFHFGLPNDVLNSALIKELMSKGYNFKRYEKGRGGLDKNSNFLDPWGMQYQIVLDLDNNQVCDLEDSIYGSANKTEVAIWSWGADMLPNTIDDVLSWKN